MPAYTSTRYAYEGTETTETSITRVGGASDPTGQAQSRKIVTTANSQWLRPFRAEPYAIWNPTTGANVTVTVCGTVNAGTLPNNDDVWLEVEYLGDATSTLGKIVTTTKANLLAANAVVAPDSSTWNGTSNSGTTWDSATAHNVTLSNGNLSVTNTTGASNDCGARLPASFRNGGKFYFEGTFTTIVGGAANSIGIALSTISYYADMTNVTSGYNSVRTSGAILSNGSATGITLGARASGDVIGLAIDLDNRQMWARVAPSGNWNNSGTANPATNTGGIAIPAGAMAPVCNFGGSGSAANNVTTVNFGATAFSGTVPSGFASGWPTDWSPFKLTTTLSAPQPGQAGYIHVRPRIAKPSTTIYLDPQVTLS